MRSKTSKSLSKSQHLRRKYGIPELHLRHHYPPVAHSFDISSVESSDLPENPQKMSWFRRTCTTFRFRTSKSAKSKQQHIGPYRAPPSPATTDDDLIVPSRIQSILNSLIALDSQLETLSLSVVQHRSSLRNCQHLNDMVQQLKQHHLGLKRKIGELKRVYEDVLNEEYLLEKIGAWNGGWGDELVREMVRKRVLRLKNYLNENFDAAEREIMEAETECLNRVLRPAGLELSLVF
ncbi:hypothetical protein BZA77DRAFT_46601 [Pyronema omphalodes]|nr:hypothetical protein BZA77DRAFT_46601 [Pyronema omphalodes]